MTPHGRTPPAPGISRRSFLGWLGLAGGASLTSPASAEARDSMRTVEIVEQRPETGACGPCAVGNALLNGDDAARGAFGQLPGANARQRVDALIARYGSKPSETYGARRARFVAGAGITNEDMPFLANDLLTAAGLPPVRGVWLDQGVGEDGAAQLRRVHTMSRGALAAGLPLVVEVRSFAADSSATASKPMWVNLYAHWLALVGVYPETLPARANGFTCQFADSVTGRVISAFVYAETVRPFMATRGFSLRADGSKDWRWLSGYPYLLVNLPDLPLAVQTRPWNQRACVALTYALRRGAA